MKPFTYSRPASVAQARAAVAEQPHARYLAGGTNLVDLMRLGVAAPDVLIDLGELGLDGVRETPGGGLVIGAGETMTAVSAHPGVRERYPALAQALVNGASPQLRNRATIGGNLLQRTRCLYFQDVTKPCNKREPGSGCPAIEGEHHNLAILGWSESCIATHPSDMAVALVMLDAQVHVAGDGGERRLPLAGMYAAPGDRPDRETVLDRSDVITAVELPGLEIAARSSYRKARERASFAFALVSVAAAVQMRDGLVEDVRLALGGVAHKPWRASRFEQALRGRELSREALREAADAELAEARPLRDTAYKVPMARNMMITAVLDLGVQAA